jgi:uncharacterized protein (DUF2249 family)
MSDLLLASNEADAQAVEAVEQHHAALAGSLDQRVRALLSTGGTLSLRDELVAWCERELIPHAAAEEESLYPAARVTEPGRLLVDAMLAEHHVLVGLVHELTVAGDHLHAAASAAALRAVFSSHLAKENDQLLPLLAATPGVSVAALLGGMHEVLGTRPEDGGATADGCGGTCSCGEADDPGLPELDVRSVPHAIRHATVFGALDSLTPGAGLELVASHDPLPLLGQVEQRWPRRFTVSYLERGPEDWRLSLVRAAG